MKISLPIKNKAEIDSIKDLYRKNHQISELLMFTLAINTGIDLIDLLNLKVIDVNYMKYKDLSYLQWLFNQSKVTETLKFIGVKENMNLRYREGVCL